MEPKHLQLTSEHLPFNKNIINSFCFCHQQMQSQLHESPNLPAIAYLIHNDSIRRFIENGSVPSVKFFIDQLDVVDNAACSWLSLIKGIKLDIFKGFRTEEELVDYFLNQAYHDGVTVLASK